ncbi:MAG: N-acetyltransferase [Planctomycetota bacterium]
MSHQPITVRNATLADLEPIVAFNAAMAEETEHKTLELAVLREGVRHALQSPEHCRYFVAEVDLEIVGQTMITFEWSDWRNGFFWWIQSVYVGPEFRRIGVFKRLHSHIRDLARQDPQVCGLRLYVHHDNTRALGTYAKLGMPPSAYFLCEEDWSVKRDSVRPSGA